MENDQIIAIAKQAIISKINGENFTFENISSDLLQPKACFVTLTINGRLRGCIGSLNAHRPLVEDIKANAIAAAFEDNRFLPLTKKEVGKINVAVSVLSQPFDIEYHNAEELLSQINSDMGIILSYQNKSATFLPQVWQDIPDKVELLEALAQKAGLKTDDWKHAKMNGYYVTAYH
jgi:AmmeMemoRadiSam system protein A